MAKKSDKATVKKSSVKTRAGESVKSTKKSKAAKPSKGTKSTKSSKSSKASAAKTDKQLKFEASAPKPFKEKLSKTQLLEHIAEDTGLDKKDVKKVMESLEQTMLASIRKKGIGEFMFPGLFKVVAKKVPAKKGGETKMSFGKEIVTKAKPATTKIKIRPMKKMKDMAVI